MLLVGWIVVAVIAAFDPAGLQMYVASFIPVRRDTLGIVCFALSASLFLVSAVLRRRSYPLLRTVRVFAGATVVYLLTNALTHPETMRMPLTHLVSWPSELATLILASGAFVTTHATLIIAARSAKQETAA